MSSGSGSELAERVTGDLRAPDSLKKAVSGCDAVFHVAADYRLWVRDPEQMYKANVEGTRALLKAAKNSKVPRTRLEALAEKGVASLNARRL